MESKQKKRTQHVNIHVNTNIGSRQNKCHDNQTFCACKADILNLVVIPRFHDDQDQIGTENGRAITTSKRWHTNTCRTLSLFSWKKMLTTFVSKGASHKCPCGLSTPFLFWQTTAWPALSANPPLFFQLMLTAKSLWCWPQRWQAMH